MGDFRVRFREFYRGNEVEFTFATMKFKLSVSTVQGHKEL
jgi:hypothetical protein